VWDFEWGKEKEVGGGCSERQYHYNKETKDFTDLIVLRQCPLALLLKVGWRHIRALGSEPGTVMGRGLLEYAAGGRSRTFGLHLQHCGGLYVV
jgi:hypothetical protein